MTQSMKPEDNSSAVVITDRHGAVRYLNEFGELHREGDLPAVVSMHGTFYYKNGALHRDNGPAYIGSMQEVYYKNGMIHREGDLPAITHFIKNDKGEKQIMAEEYYKNGVLHRDNAPALMWSTGSYQHYKNGKFHNDKGPACHYVENEKTTDEYYLDGVQVPKLIHKILSMRTSSDTKTNKMKM